MPIPHANPVDNCMSGGICTPTSWPRWAGITRRMKTWEEVLPQGSFLSVHLVTNFEVEAQRIVQYCDLEWSEACMFFYKTDRPVRTASAFQVRKPVFHGSMEGLGAATGISPYRAFPFNNDSKFL